MLSAIYNLTYHNVTLRKYPLTSLEQQATQMNNQTKDFHSDETTTVRSNFPATHLLWVLLPVPFTLHPVVVPIPSSLSVLRKEHLTNHCQSWKAAQG